MSADRGAGEIAAALADRIEDLAAHLVGEQPTMRSRNQIRFFPRGGLAVTTSGAQRGVWCSHGDGGIGGDALDLVKHLRQCSMADALGWAREWLGNQGAGAGCIETSVRREVRHAAEPVQTAETARQVWRGAVNPHGTPVEAYLNSRGLTLSSDAPLRFHPACPRRSERLPAMVALMTNPVTAEPCGVHRTFLRPDGHGKADGQAKMMIGNAGVVRLVADAEVTMGLGIAEGIETALAVMQLAGWSPIWAACSASGIAKFPVLAGIECITIFTDRDDKGAGLNSARECAARWHEAGRGAIISQPPDGTDWHDALTATRAA